jgi:hypothetical protein
MNNLGYINIGKLSLSGANPSATPTPGGELITIIGYGFSSSSNLTVRYSLNSSCSMDVAILNTTIISISGIVSLTPAAACGSGQYAMSLTKDGTLFTPSIPFSFYLPTYRVTSLAPASPRSGLQSGGARITLTGTDLIASSSALCRFGSSSTSALSVTC